MLVEIIITVLVTLVVSLIVSAYFNRKILLLISEGKKAKKELRNIKQKKRRVNSKLFNEIRLAKGLSGFQLGIETEISSQSVQCLLTGRRNPRPATVKKVGEYLRIPPNKWYITKKSI